MARRIISAIAFILIISSCYIGFYPSVDPALDEIPFWLRGRWGYGRAWIEVTPYNIFGYTPDGHWFDIGRYSHHLIHEESNGDVYMITIGDGSTSYTFGKGSSNEVLFTFGSGGSSVGGLYRKIR